MESSVLVAELQRVLRTFGRILLINLKFPAPILVNLPAQGSVAAALLLLRNHLALQLRLLRGRRARPGSRTSGGGGGRRRGSGCRRAGRCGGGRRRLHYCLGEDGFFHPRLLEENVVVMDHQMRGCVRLMAHQQVTQP